ncbi:hypothetical protein ARMGADRAFT_147710 [Armillaria gallica]|uniref:Uncharacterized protein n=1 Tax=Armillaria gallica TaxID=47427 RepID=A0A2H3DG61_ARMGA|nr:hypothetical protein ARMGADRAFT_147710 [Armillaria gallica]
MSPSVKSRSSSASLLLSSSRPSTSLHTPTFPQILRSPHAPQQMVWCIHFALASVNRRDTGAAFAMLSAKHLKQAEEAAKATNATEEKVVRGSADEEEPNALKKEAAQGKRKATMAANVSAKIDGTKRNSGDDDGINQ